MDFEQLHNYPHLTELRPHIFITICVWDFIIFFLNFYVNFFTFKLISLLFIWVNTTPDCVFGIIDKFGFDDIIFPFSVYLDF